MFVVYKCLAMTKYNLDGKHYVCIGIRSLNVCAFVDLLLCLCVYVDMLLCLCVCICGYVIVLVCAFVDLSFCL